jgi:hypothetical protein
VRLDQYLLSKEDKERQEEEKIVALLKELGGVAKIEFHQKDQDSKAFFGISYEQLMLVVGRLKIKGVLDYRSDYDPGHVNYRRIFLSKRMRAVIATPAIRV